MTFTPGWNPAPKPERKAPKEPKPLNKRNEKRWTANHQRAYGEYADYIRSLPCIVCQLKAIPHAFTEAAHSRTGGTGRKSDAKWLVPLCGSWGIQTDRGIDWQPGHHAESHAGIETFESKYSVDLKAEAKKLWSSWRSSQREDVP